MYKLDSVDAKATGQAESVFELTILTKAKELERNEVIAHIERTLRTWGAHFKWTNVNDREVGRYVLRGIQMPDHQHIHECIMADTRVRFIEKVT